MCTFCDQLLHVVPKVQLVENISENSCAAKEKPGKPLNGKHVKTNALSVGPLIWCPFSSKK